MNLSIVQYIFLGIMLFLTGLIDAISGGGGLISLPAFLMVGIPPHMAIATNKFLVLGGTITSNIRYIKEKLINYKLAIPCMVTGAIGSYIGSKLSLLTDEKVLMIALIIILPVTAVLVLNKKLFNDNGKDTIEFNLKNTLIASAIIFTVAIYDGFYGPGAGTFYLLAFTILLKLKVKTANAQIKFISIASNITAFLTFLFHGQMLLVIGAYGCLCDMIGTYVGTNLVIKNGAKVAKPSIIFVLCLLVIKIVSEFIL